MPFRGGGAPQMRVVLRVADGEAAVYVRHHDDLVATARLLSGVRREVAEAAREPGDSFDGYLRSVARPDAPATLVGEPTLLGSRVVLLVEALGREALGIQIDVDPV
jgi:hypothetical protein